MKIQESVASLLEEIIEQVVNWDFSKEESAIEPILKSNSSGFERCRICFESNGKAGIIHPCICKGTMGAVHLKCLERWLEESYTSSCELCGYRFQVVRTPRYNVFRSIWIWLYLDEEEYLPQVRSLRVDLVRFFIVTPLTIACTYMCLVATDFYTVKKYKNYVLPTITWSSYSLLFFMSLLLLSYFIWVFMAVQYHQKLWFDWWKKQSNVKIIIPNVGSQNYEKFMSQRVFT